jgi:hypothetical protein
VQGPEFKSQYSKKKEEKRNRNNEKEIIKEIKSKQSVNTCTMDRN